jgi:PAS domain S-box-containing protein
MAGLLNVPVVEDSEDDTTVLLEELRRNGCETVHKRARDKATLQYLAAIIESTDDAIYGKTPDGVITTWNRAAERIYGYPAGEIIGHSVALLFPIDRRDELIDLMERVKRGECVGLHETVHVHSDGRYIPVSVTVSPIKDGDGKIIGASTIARDITKCKRAEAERAKLIQKLTDALSQINSGSRAPAPMATSDACPQNGQEMDSQTSTRKI